MYNSLKNTQFRPKKSRKFTNILYLLPSKNYNNLHFDSIFRKSMTFFAHRGGYCAMCQFVLLYSFLARCKISKQAWLYFARSKDF